MASTKPNPLSGFGRGIFGLKNWEQLRKPLGRGGDRERKAMLAAGGSARPGGNSSRSVAPPPGITVQPSQDVINQNTSMISTLPTQKAQPSNNNTAGSSQKREGPKIGTQLMAKYSYKANPSSPLGHELSFKQEDKLKFIEVHATNAEWWVAETCDGTLGYVPAKYMVSMEVSSLPWLQNKQVEEDKPPANSVFGLPEKGYVKPYNCTFDHPELKMSGSGGNGGNQWRCDICEKDFNGPKPYQAHMLSKAHREEVALREEYA